MVILHAYVLRELLKTFGLALLALTVLFTMGGGLYNVISYEGVSAADVLRFMPYLVPIVITLTMPMAALFAATMVYGRLAADNELTACRAAGIDVQRLFLAVGLLALLVALFTLVFGSFVIPRFMERVDDFVRANIRDVVAQNLQRKGFIHRGRRGEERHALTAERVQGVAEAALAAKGFETAPGLHYLQIKNPTYLHIDADGNLVRFAVAKWGLVVFDTRPTPIQLSLLVRDGRDFEVGRSAVAVGQQRIGPWPLPLPAQVRLSTADLRDLLHWRRHIWEVPRFAALLDLFLLEVQRELFFAHCAAALADGGTLMLTDDLNRTHRVTAAAVQAGREGLVLDDVGVTIAGPDGAALLRYEAPQAELRAVPFGTELLVETRLVRTAQRDVWEYPLRAGDPAEPRSKPTLSLDGLGVPAEVKRQAAELPRFAVLDEGVGLPVSAPLRDRRMGLQKEAAQERRNVSATIHFRLAYALSVLATAPMGAVLGVLFRGSRGLAAFALAMIPLFSVMILMVLGRQLAEDALTTAWGPGVTWGGLGLVLLADGVLLRLGVRR